MNEVQNLPSIDGTKVFGMSTNSDIVNQQSETTRIVARILGVSSDCLLALKPEVASAPSEEVKKLDKVELKSDKKEKLTKEQIQAQFKQRIQELNVKVFGLEVKAKTQDEIVKGITEQLLRRLRSCSPSTTRVRPRAVRDVVAPLRALEERSGEMSKGQLARPVPPWGDADELGRLAVIFEEMRRSLRDRLRSTESINVDLEREVRRRTEALEQRNAELRDALDKLRRAQDNLIRSEKLASMGRLVAGIAHEINNPVNAVINSLGPLEEAVGRIAAVEPQGPIAKLAAEASEILAVVQRGAARTKSIVQALHGYARGDESVEREVFLARSVEDTLGLLQHRLRHVQIVKDVDPEARIRGFPGQVDQVLMNLLTNAAQAIGDRGGTIRVSAQCRDTRVLLTVSDDGPGIPVDVLPRIFDPFFTTKDVGEGSGLGLSIVHGIIERHGGEIDVASKPGQGTTFTISFPRPGVEPQPGRTT